MKALERLNQSRNPQPKAIKLSDKDRMNLNIWLARKASEGWTKEDRAEYLAACKQEFDNPTAAGGVEGAVSFWAREVAA